MLLQSRYSRSCDAGTKSRREGKHGKVYVPAYHMPHKDREEARGCGLQVRGDDTGVDAVSRYALGAKAFVQGACVDDGGDFGVAVTFPGDELLMEDGIV